MTSGILSAAKGMPHHVDSLLATSTHCKQEASEAPEEVSASSDQEAQGSVEQWLVVVVEGRIQEVRVLFQTAALNLCIRTCHS